MSAVLTTYSWLIRRELWERRTVWMLPGIISIIVILLALFGRFKFIGSDSPAPAWGLVPYLLSVIFFCFAVVSASFYLLDCLYEDRRDRSILFWKSLPISDTDSVLSKLIMGLVVIPLVSFLVADFTALIASIVISVRESSMVSSQLWHGESWWNLQLLWLYIIGTAAVWYLPLAGWMMLVSATVKRAPILWAVLPFLLDGLIEHFFLGTQFLDRMIGRWIASYPAAAINGHHVEFTDAGGIPTLLGHMLDLKAFLLDWRTWLSAVIGAALIFAAIQVRMRRTES